MSRRCFLCHEKLDTDYVEHILQYKDLQIMCCYCFNLLVGGLGKCSKGRVSVELCIGCDEPCSFKYPALAISYLGLKLTMEKQLAIKKEDRKYRKRLEEP